MSTILRRSFRHWAIANKLAAPLDLTSSQQLRDNNVAPPVVDDFYQAQLQKIKAQEQRAHPQQQPAFPPEIPLDDSVEHLWATRNAAAGHQELIKKKSDWHPAIQKLLDDDDGDDEE